MSEWRTYPDGDHPLDRLMAALRERGADAIWHDYGDNNDVFHGIELTAGGSETLLKVSGEAHSIHDRWWDASYLPIIVLDPDAVLADPGGVADDILAGRIE